MRAPNRILSQGSDRPPPVGLLTAYAAAALLLAMAFASCAPAHYTGPLPDEPEDFTFAQLEDARVRYIDVGSGPTVVLVHGFASSLNIWAGIVPVLAPEFRVIALDLKGFGWTDRPPGDYSPPAQAELVFELLDRLGVDRFALVAHSWGSSVALSMALAQPKRVERIALYSAWVFEEQLPSFFLWARHDAVGETLFRLYYRERVDERMARAFYNKKLVTEESLAVVMSVLDRPGTLAAALAATRGQRLAELQTRYREIVSPTLLLWGENDEVAHPSFARRLQATLPYAERKMYPQCGHFPMIEAAAASTADLAAFLRTTAQQAEVSP